LPSAGLAKAQLWGLIVVFHPIKLMSRYPISLKSRVRYEGRVTTIDRRATRGADVEKIPDRLWFTVSQILRSKFRKPILVKDPAKPVAKSALKKR
jgi:hypothetical protein